MNHLGPCGDGRCVCWRWGLDARLEAAGFPRPITDQSVRDNVAAWVKGPYGPPAEEHRDRAVRDRAFALMRGPDGIAVYAEHAEDFLEGCVNRDCEQDFFCPGCRRWRCFCTGGDHGGWLSLVCAACWCAVTHGGEIEDEDVAHLGQPPDRAQLSLF